MTWRNNVVQSNATGNWTGSQLPADAAPPPSASNTRIDEMMQSAMVFTAVLMAILGGTLCVVRLDRLIHDRFTLFSMVCFLLRFTTLVLFLPLLSYTRSNAKEGEEILFVLLWMLLIELFRNKVEAMVPSGNRYFSRSANRFRLMDHSDEVTRLVWIGFLIYSNIDWQKEEGVLMMMPMFVILWWSLAVVKLGQRMLNQWKAQDSLSAAGSANIIAGYMQLVLEQEKEKEKEEARRHRDGGCRPGPPDLDTAMGNCQYVVMGEEKLVPNKKESRRRQRTGSKVFLTTPHCGYGVGTFPRDQNELKHVRVLVDLDKIKFLVTVKDVWRYLEHWVFGDIFGKKRAKIIDHMCLMCLSFSLFKLLRRRFEHYPMVEVGSKMSRQLLADGLLNCEKGGSDDNASRAFRVIQLELDFLDNYYQAGVPVVMSARWLLFINFLSCLLFVSIYVATVAKLVFITPDPDNDQYTAVHTKYSIITMLLVITLLAVEITNFLTAYLFSNWFLVHLLCLYASPGGCLWNCLFKPIISCFIAFRIFLFYSHRLVLKLINGRPIFERNMNVRQVSVLQVCEPVHKIFAWTSHVRLPTDVMVAIVMALKTINLDMGVVSLPHLSDAFSFSHFTRGKTATEIILACHLATELLEVKYGKPKKKKKKTKKNKTGDGYDGQAVATTLSRYCMYLLARAPELLPDGEGWVSDRYEEVTSCLKEVSSSCRCCWCSTWWWCCPWRHAAERWKAVAEMEVQLKSATAQAGVELCQQLVMRTKDDAWKDLAEFWVRLLIYLAPSNDVEGHARFLATSGSDLITCLWTLCTHAGIKRNPSEPEAELHAGTHFV
ncbi:hypothetical protein BDA96_10G141800 [Sorghum bicolor]|uniref:DUF4220 domain-containing protein n=2 Tax=Sorghum bicolor TaxID=4558 RepID=A0A921Q229_SORBI|nr:uncharacterized protein LOC8076390 [Sorghum bicolor]EER89602.1 hypothetical protein SORBI_3010G116100 [Sorghum bicolor]KAG0513887.1 hypothetical protein BDA96_10G141800 [Sorghum bicolor]|eukprot:XP_002438235.1 uncharacterized protein LOC8076390 [Sorghum bicolor]